MRLTGRIAACATSRARLPQCLQVAGASPATDLLRCHSTTRLAWLKYSMPYCCMPARLPQCLQVAGMPGSEMPRSSHERLGFRAMAPATRATDPYSGQRTARKGGLGPAVLENRRRQIDRTRRKDVLPGIRARFSVGKRAIIQVTMALTLTTTHRFQPALRWGDAGDLEPKRGVSKSCISLHSTYARDNPSLRYRRPSCRWRS